ncbi:MAG: hypothetical protein HN912_00145 [Candidatus Pacebacteria bacterium]|nr:hypothetical protein [Candidatus Paceibacterota bacterium]MBT3511692.1 hypothetical protein [Candidatus Paceibacterota bacterium]MBT4005337.1 hypothetical protein [Candidatus Paceibacterota bacterium]MBT7183258.1 hypothetical protein [Candidatus Paceibacterota bacterium]MBT7499694.1 hypothetical protein [Candidatus Paceibacterota bacterium]
MSDNILADINWDKLFWALQSESVQTALQNVPKTTLEYLLNEDNREKVIASVQKSLAKTKGEQVSWVEAEILVKKMQAVAKMVAEEKV